jgi:hypothetical protein
MNALTSRFALALAGAGIALASGCSSSSSPSPFNGTWSCTQTATLQGSSGAPTVHTSSVTLILNISDGQPITVESAPTDAGKIGDAGTGCSLTFDTSGPSATLSPGQTCPFSYADGAGTLAGTITFTTGSGPATSTALTFTTAATYAGTLSSGTLSDKLSGSDDITTKCMN